MFCWHSHLWHHTNLLISKCSFWAASVLFEPRITCPLWVLSKTKSNVEPQKSTIWSLSLLSESIQLIVSACVVLKPSSTFFTDFKSLSVPFSFPSGGPCSCYSQFFISSVWLQVIVHILRSDCGGWLDFRGEDLPEPPLQLLHVGRFGSSQMEAASPLLSVPSSKRSAHLQFEQQWTSQLETKSEILETHFTVDMW